jgi:hypothetical protein
VLSFVSSDNIIEKQNYLLSTLDITGKELPNRVTTRSNSISSENSSCSSKRNHLETSPEAENSNKRPVKLRKPSSKKMATVVDKLDKILSTLTLWEPSIRKIETIHHQVREVSDSVIKLDERVSTLETDQSSKEDVKSIKIELDKSIAAINVLQQNSLSNDFVLYGLPPEVTNEEKFEILAKFTEELNEKIKETDLKQIYIRSNKNNTEKLICGSFYSSEQKERILKKFKTKIDPIVVEDIVDVAESSTWRGREIVLKNQLSAATRKLLSEARTLNQGCLKFIWESKGRVLVRKDENSTPIEIRSTVQLSEILARTKTTTK